METDKCQMPNAELGTRQVSSAGSPRVRPGEGRSWNADYRIHLVALVPNLAFGIWQSAFERLQRHRPLVAQMFLAYLEEIRPRIHSPDVMQEPAGRLDAFA